MLLQRSNQVSPSAASVLEERRRGSHPLLLHFPVYTLQNFPLFLGRSCPLSSFAPSRPPFPLGFYAAINPEYPKGGPGGRGRRREEVGTVG